MNTKPLKDVSLNEHLLHVEPSPGPFVDAGWRGRPQFYTGRALSSQALSADQREHSGRLALRGQTLSPGVVTGLEVQLDATAAVVHLEPGMGLTALGEDVFIPRGRTVRIASLPVYRPGSLGPGGFELGLLGSVDPLSTHGGLRAAVLVLVPVVSRLEDPPDPTDPGEVDPERQALEDPQWMDGCALVLFAWPSDWTLPPFVLSDDQARWRNRLAWEVFEQERQRASGQVAPWEEVGVPLALMGFTPPVVPGGAATALFADQAAVVRVGGAPRSRTPWLDARGSPLLWQARTLQFAEQLATLSPEVLASPLACASFDLLPPVGRLPKEAIDLFTWSHRFFPAGFRIEALPVPLEQLDAVVRASASLAPLSTSELEQVRVLVPVPEAHFEPGLLLAELLDPAFDEAIDAALQRLGEGLERRADLRAKATLLADALDGVMPEHGYPATDPEAVPGEWVSTAPLVPPEETYGTAGSLIPVLDSALPPPRLTVMTKGVRGLLGELDALNQKVLGFISDGLAQVQASEQQLRQLMSTSSTEAARLAVSNIQDRTLVASPLLTSFSPISSRTQLIRLSDPLEALQQATALRRDLTERLLDLVGEASQLKEFGLDVSGMQLLEVPQLATEGGIRVISLMPRGLRWTIGRQDYSLTELLANPTLRQEVLTRLEDEQENLRRALAQRNVRWVESDYFATATRHLDNVRTLLQELARRMNARGGTVGLYRRVLSQLEGFWTQLSQRLQAVEGEVAEARQDVTVGRALLAEEAARIAGINQRRAQVFAQHVPFLVFQRPRGQALTRDGASRLLDSALTGDLLPEVLASTAAAPPELLSYCELVRDAPLKSFTLAPQLLSGLDRLEIIQRTYVQAQTRVQQRVPIELPTLSGGSLTRLAQGLSQVLSAQQDVLARGRLTLLQAYPTATLETKTWLELQQSAHTYLSLGDLIDPAHGRPDVGRAAAAELEHIAKVATGLYQRFGEVLPAIRLEWAEQLSQYDAPVELRELSWLPRWDGLEGTARRELQTLVDWLFQRVVSTEPEAVSLMNDLVRVCLLLASHAPVNELLSGHVSTPTVARVGGLLELAVDPSRVRIGMSVHIQTGDQTVEAVVEDVSSGIARARVVTASAETVGLPEKSSASFLDLSRGPGALQSAPASFKSSR